MLCEASYKLYRVGKLGIHLNTIRSMIIFLTVMMSFLTRWMVERIFLRKHRNNTATLDRLTQGADTCIGKYFTPSPLRPHL